MPSRRVAFTLAEVLITLAIVGIVAALTLPNLLTTMQGNKHRQQFKKALSTLNQAVRSAQAHYDLDYASLNQTCGDNPSNENPDERHSLCAVFNATLKGARYLPEGEYTPSITIGGVSDFYAYQMADGSVVGFNKNLKDCALPNETHSITSEMFGSGQGLTNCVGFIDVNGNSGPNQEIKCADGTSTLGNGSCELLTKGVANSDIFPIVFHNGSVEPATDSSRSAFTASAIISGNSGIDGGSGTSAEQPSKKTVMYKGNEYTLFPDGNYYREDENGELSSPFGNSYIKTNDGGYKLKYYDGDIYDKDMNLLERRIKGIWYKKINGELYTEDANGNLITQNGMTLTKTADGGYTWGNSSWQEVYDKDVKRLGVFRNGTWYDNMNGKFLREKGNGELVDTSNHTYVKNSDGGYTRTDGNQQFVFDKDLNDLKYYYNDSWYDNINGNWLRDDGSGNLVTPGGSIYTKRDDGLYEDANYIYDNELRRIGTK